MARRPSSPAQLADRVAALEAELARLRERVEALERPRQPMGFFVIAGSRIQQDLPRPPDVLGPRAGR